MQDGIQSGLMQIMDNEFQDVTTTSKKSKVIPRRSSRKRMCSRYLDEDMVTLEDTSLWSPALSRALQERYGDNGRKRTPRTLTRLMQQHRENERHRHHGLNASIREISERIPGFEEENKETKIVKLQRIINYICHLELNIKNVCDDIGFSLDYKSLFLSPHITKTPDDWKPGPKSSSTKYLPLPRKYTALCLKQNMEGKQQTRVVTPSEGTDSPQNLPGCSSLVQPSASCAQSSLPKRLPAHRQTSTRTSVKVPSKTTLGKATRGNATRGKGRQRGFVHARSAKTDLTYGVYVPGQADVCSVEPDTYNLPGTSIGDCNTILNHDTVEEDLTWLDSMMEAATADMTAMCDEVLQLPDLLSDLPPDREQLHTIPAMHSQMPARARDPLYLQGPVTEEDLDQLGNSVRLESPNRSPGAFLSWAQVGNATPNAADVSTFHSYARKDNDVSSSLLDEWKLEADEDYALEEPQGSLSPLLDGDPFPPLEKVEVEFNDGSDTFQIPERWQQSEFKPVDAPNEHLPPPIDISPIPPSTDTVEKRQEKPTRVDLRKTSWMNGFMMYSRLHRKRYIEENPGVHTSHISRLMGQDWRMLNPSAKQPYRVKAQHYINDYLLPQLVPNFKKKNIKKE